MGNAPLERGNAPSVEARVLGPLEVSVGGAEPELGGRRARLVLALLIAHADRAVSTDRLIDDIWGDETPSTAKKAVQVHVSNLRRTLGTDFPLKTAPGGYVIQSASVEIDSLVFGRDVERATSSLRTDPAATSQTLAAALSTWRGTPYADLMDEPALRPEIDRLSELRLVALEHRIDADLRLGRHTDLIGELAALITDHPYRERLSGFHMLALYRSGRQTEALRAYDHTRSMLHDELGIEPSPELQTLHHQILEHSADLDVREPGGGDRYAFLATDIEASTAMWEAEPDQMQHSLARHDSVLETSVAAHGGRVFKRTGDGMYAVFGSARDAAAAAIDAQIALADADWETSRPLRARMSVDEGVATARGEDYFGPVVNRVSRVMASAHGGQVVVPAELVDRVGAPSRLLGPVDYRGLGRIELAQLQIDGLPGDFPELRVDRSPTATQRGGFGRVIRGYELRERLGEGAHGVVYRAYQAVIGREVAIKIIRPDLANRSDFVSRFEAEAQFVAQLEHPHIVSMYDYWRDPDGAYLVMQLLRGGSLAASLERSPWRPPAALHLLDQVGSALDYAHRQGIVHRDLKPGNVLLDDEGHAYLTDFGIAAHHVEASGLPVESSAAYVSPEELAGAPSGTSTDVYGMALLAYEIMTGDRPRLGGYPRPVGQARNDLPVALDDVLTRGAHPDPEARYPRISDFTRALRRVFGIDVVPTGITEHDVEIRNPFKGLRAFGETDAADFAGRDDLVTELVGHVAARQLTIVVGPSGSGKSSLVRAGLFPAVRRGELDTAGQTLVTEMYPGSFPFEELESALLKVSVERPDDLLSDLLGDERGLMRVSKQILPDDDSELLLVIDQFEELFSLTADGRVRQQFLRSLVTIAEDARSRVRIVATLRADYLDRPLAVPDFGSFVTDALFPVPVPTRDELARVILDPTTAAGLDFESGLIPRIIDDVIDQPGALPLLQYALTELVDSCDGSVLTSNTYERIGGVTGALSTRAEEIYGGLGPGAQEVAREVFLRLVTVGDSTEDTRRRVRRTELESLGLAEATLDLVLSAYGAFRLLTFDLDPVTRGPTVEVAHEALIREWPRFRAWVDERREDLLMERRLDVAVAEWEASDRDPSYLYSAGHLEQYERWTESAEVRLTDIEQQFLDAGRDAEDVRSTRGRSRRRRVLVALSGLAVLALLLAGIAVVQRNTAQDKAALAKASTEDAQNAAELALEASREADDAKLEAQEQRALAEEQRAAAEEQRAAADSQAILANESADAVERTAKTALASALAPRVADALKEDHDAGLLLAVAASDLLDSAGTEDPEVMESLDLATATHRVIRRFEVAGSPFSGFDRQPPARVAAAPDGRRLAIIAKTDGQDGGDALIIDLITGEPLQQLDADGAATVHWDMIRDEVLVGGDGRLTAFDPDTGSATEEFDVAPGLVHILQTTDSYLVYRLLHDRSVRLGGSDIRAITTVVADRGTGEIVRRYDETSLVRLAPSETAAEVLAQSDPVTADLRVESFPSREPRAGAAGFGRGTIAWLPDDTLLWQSFPALRHISTNGSTIDEGVIEDPVENAQVAAALSPNQRWVALEQENGAITVHDATTLERVEEVTLAQTRPIETLVWAGDSRRIVTVDDQDVAIVWDLTEARRAPESIWTGSTMAPAAFISLGGSEIVLVGFDDFPVGSGSLVGARWERWNTEQPILLDRSRDLQAQTATIWGNPDSGGLLSETDGVGVGVRLTEPPSTTPLFQTTEYDNPAGTSPDGTHIAVSRTFWSVVVEPTYPGHGFALYDVDTGDAVLETEGTFTNGASFSPDGRSVLFAVGGLDGSGSVDDAGKRTRGVLVYDTSSGELVADLDVEGGAWATQISGSGRLLAIAGATGIVEVHDFEDVLDGGPSLIGRSATGRENPVNRPFFSDDERILYTTELPPATNANAWSVGEEMTRLWSIPSAIGLVQERDGLIWMPAQGALPLDEHPGHAGFIGIPLTRSAYGDFARSKATRDFTEQECETFFDSACAAFEALIE